MSRERPILFNADMVRAILDGRKTQTRRVVKPQPEYRENESLPGHFGTWLHGWNLDHECVIPSDYWKHCPHGQPGDRLWVRETWMNLKGTGVSGSPDPKFNPKQIPVAYRAECTAEGEDARIDMGLKWRPSIYMPRWASRINLEITGVRVERLQDISDDDVWAEGWESVSVGNCDYKNFGELWESISGPGSWDANPWVWVIEFRRLP